MPSIPKAFALLVPATLALICGCSTLSVERVGSAGAAATKNGGLPYSLEKPVILATVQRSVVFDGSNIVNNIDLGRFVDSTTFSLALVKDPDQTYAIALNPGWFTADTQDIVYNARGGLNSYNFTSTDQAATVVATIGKIASTAALFGVAAGVEDAPPPPGTGEIETATQKAYQKVLSDLAALSAKNGSMSKDDLAQFDALLKEAQNLKPLIYPTTTHTIQAIDAPIVFIDSAKSIDDVLLSDAPSYYKDSKFGLIGIARRLQ